MPGSCLLFTHSWKHLALLIRASKVRSFATMLQVERKEKSWTHLHVYCLQGMTLLWIIHKAFKTLGFHLHLLRRSERLSICLLLDLLPATDMFWQMFLIYFSIKKVCIPYVHKCDRFTSPVNQTFVKYVSNIYLGSSKYEHSNSMWVNSMSTQ